MAGVRLRHKTLRGVMYVVMHPTRKLRKPMDCPACRNVHFHKTYHLQLDGEGAAIVSETVYERLREAGLPDLEVENEVLVPPAQSISLDSPQAVAAHYQVAEVEGGRLAVLRNRLLKPRLRRTPNG